MIQPMVESKQKSKPKKNFINGSTALKRVVVKIFIFVYGVILFQ
jgi:hypothetical protein